jgi:anti-anti-sigma factor
MEIRRPIRRSCTVGEPLSDLRRQMIADMEQYLSRSVRRNGPAWPNRPETQRADADGSHSRGPDAGNGFDNPTNGKIVERTNTVEIVKPQVRSRTNAAIFRRFFEPCRVTVVEVRTAPDGYLDYETVRELVHPVLNLAAEDHADPIIIDLSAVRSVNGMFVNLVVALQRRLRSQCRRVALCGLHPRCAEFIRLCGVSIECHPTLKTALLACWRL